MKTFSDLLKEHFKLKDEDIHPALTSHDVPEWDSMNYLLFIADLEKEYNVSFSMDEVLSAGTIGEIENMLRAKGASL